MGSFMARVVLSLAHMHFVCFAFGQSEDGAQTDTSSQPPECLDYRHAPPREWGEAVEEDLLKAKCAVPTSAVSSYGALAEKSRQGNQPRLT